MAGPLATLTVVEFAGLGPAPLAGQLLADLGARVIVVDRGSAPADPTDINRRGKRSVALNLKTREGLEAAKRLIEGADILIEGFRPGVMERLGLGPQECPERLIYGRMTGWGQTGPWSATAGHDINYLAMTGALRAFGPGRHIANLGHGVYPDTNPDHVKVFIETVQQFDWKKQHAAAM